MNKTYCNGKFVLKEEMDEKDIAWHKSIDREIRRETVASLSKDEVRKRRREIRLSRRIADTVLGYLKAIGHDAYDVKFEEGSLYPYGWETVTFKVRGAFLRKYLFGMWIHSGNMSAKTPGMMGDKERREYNALSYEERRQRETAVEVFQQHEDYIDKFKPSRSGPVISITCEEAKSALKLNGAASRGKKRLDAEEYGWGYEDLGNLIWFMGRHPVLHFAGLLDHGDRLVSMMRLPELRRPLWNFVSRRFMHAFSTVSKSVRRWFGKRLAVRVCKGLASEDCVKSVTMTNFGKVLMPGCTSDHEYEILVDFKKGTPIAERSAVLMRHARSVRIGKIDEYACTAQVENRIDVFDVCEASPSKG